MPRAFHYLYKCKTALMKIHRWSWHLGHNIFLLCYKIFMSRDQDGTVARFIFSFILIPKGLPFGNRWYAMKAATRRWEATKDAGGSLAFGKFRAQWWGRLWSRQEPSFWVQVPWPHVHISPCGSFLASGQPGWGLSAAPHLQIYSAAEGSSVLTSLIRTFTNSLLNLWRPQTGQHLPSTQVYVPGEQPWRTYPFLLLYHNSISLVN